MGCMKILGNADKCIQIFSFYSVCVHIAETYLHVSDINKSRLMNLFRIIGRPFPFFLSLKQNNNLRLTTS